jgi:hypothetical protein
MGTGNKKYIINTLNSMSIEEARREIAEGKFGDIGSQDHFFASSWLAVKESAERDKRDLRTESISLKALRNSTWANVIAISAIIIAIIAIIIPLLIKK